MVREMKLKGPKIIETKLKSNRPISSQFKAPTITKINAIMLVIFIIPPYITFAIFIF